MIPDFKHRQLVIFGVRFEITTSRMYNLFRFEIEYKWKLVKLIGFEVKNWKVSFFNEELPF